MYAEGSQHTSYLNKSIQCNNLKSNIQQENDTRLLVISDMPMMYGDGQIRIEEGCSMLRRALLLLQKLQLNKVT